MSSVTTQVRYEGLDRLRGILALSVVFYHISTWLKIDLPYAAEQVISLLGIYAVSTFYCLSGVALFIVYNKRQVNVPFLKEFFTKRAFRICPLFWLATTISIILAKFTPILNEPVEVLLSYSLLFSWVNPSAYFTTGAWSIGNEWAFYTLFPILIWLWKYKYVNYIASLSVIVLSIIYSFVYVDPSVQLSDQWHAYISPLNQVCLFAGGLIIGSFITEREKSQTIGWSVLCISSVVFVLIALNNDTNLCITGPLRIALIVVAMAWCFGAAKLKNSRSAFAKVLDWLGGLSFSVYLLHAIVYKIVNKGSEIIVSKIANIAVDHHMVKIAILTLSILLTITLSHFVYNYFEIPLLRKCKKFIKKDQV